jgi:large subunit ribosomal protein L4
MELPIRDGAGMVDVSEHIFGAPFNEPLVHQVVTSYLAGGRAGTRGHRNRSAVSGGGSKPWRQKGTGRARAGTIRSPLWRGGGKTFATTNQDWSQKINRKQYRGAMRAILAELARQGRLHVIEELRIDQPQTKQAVGVLNQLGLSGALIVVPQMGRDVYLATRNLPRVAAIDVGSLDPVSLVGAEAVVMTVGALKAVQERLA